MSYEQVYLGLLLKRNRVLHDRESWWQDQEADNYISFTSMEQRESEPKVGQGCILSKPAPRDLLP